MGKYNTKSLFGGDEPADASGAGVVRVAFDSGVDSVFDYAVPDGIWPVAVGQRVEVPFGRGNKPVTGFCVEVLGKEEAEKSRGFRLKAVRRLVDTEVLVDSELMELARWISEYYVCPLGVVLGAMVPAAVKKGAGVKKESYVYLAADSGGDAGGEVRGAKQKQIIDVLDGAGAFDAGRGVEKNELLSLADCTEAPLKKLVSAGVVRLNLRSVLKSLPAFPEGPVSTDKAVLLNEDQVSAVEKIGSGVASGMFGVTLLYGVTDSGKTEVYIRAIEKAVEAGKSAIVLLPEIALTTQTIRRFSLRFARVAVMHSGLTGPQRNDQWQKIRAGEADVVIGARSAVFAPLGNLGLVVVDEEHEGSYKQDTAPRYNGRDVAIMRAKMAGGHCVLGSATPSLESLVNCRTKGHFQLVEMPNRVMDLPVPEMELVNLAEAFYGSGQKGINLISPVLEENLRRVLGRGEQAILLLNRRGYSNFVFCPRCGHGLHCKNCDVTLTFHKRGGIRKADTVLGSHMGSGYAICHYCLAKTLVPEKCPLCKGGMTMIGLGAQRLEEELSRKLGEAKVARVDSDSMAGGDYWRLLKDFSDGKIDILAGTQMLAKGLHFPNVTLVGVISADTSLSLPDFRANERTFQILSQVAGRAGRGEKGGKVIVQTFMPDQPAIKFAIEHDYAGFVEAELACREKCNLPPYWRMAIIGLRDEKFDRLTSACESMRGRIDEIVACGGLDVKVRGPMPATISRIGGFHRMQIVIQAEKSGTIQRFFGVLRGMGAIRPAVRVSFDIDPTNIM